jgi:hypothetical protein
MADKYVANQYVQGSCTIPCISCKRVDYFEFIYGNEDGTLCLDCINKLNEEGHTNSDLAPAIANIVVGKYKRDYDMDYIRPIIKIAIPYFSHIKIIFPIIVAGIKDDVQNVLTYIINIYEGKLLLALWGSHINKSYLYFIEYTEALTKFALLPCTASLCGSLLKSVLIAMQKNKKIVSKEQFDNVKKYSELYYKMAANMLIEGMQASKSKST